MYSIQFNDICTEVEVLLACGDKVLATPNNEHSDLFHAVSGSYGSFGILTNVTMKIRTAPKYVEVITDTFLVFTKKNSESVCLIMLR